MFKNSLLSLIVLLFSTSAFATEMVSTVAQVLDATAEGPALVFLNTEGRVLHVEAIQTELLAEFKKAAANGSTLQITFDDLGSLDLISSINVMPANVALQTENLSANLSEDEIARLDDEVYFTSWSPTVLSSYGYAAGVFNSLSTKMKNKSECFQRAHLWAYDMYTRLGIKSEKTFLFFTSRYIRQYNYKWWFHVTPHVYIPEGQVMMDVTFTGGPTDLHEWTNQFMVNHAHCPLVSSYTQYRNNQDSQYCYLRQVPMYYYQPSSIESADAQGITINSWQEWDLQNMKKAKKSGIFGD